MIRERLSGRVPLIVTTVSCTVVAALVATLALVSGGYTAQHLELGDTAVWVTNRGEQLIGRANTEINRLNTVVAADSSLVDVVQDGRSVLTVDRTSNSLGIVDPATATVGESIPLPPREPAVQAAAGRVVVTAATGEVWLASEGSLPSFDANAPATLDLGVGATTALTASGTLFAYSPDVGRLYRVDADSTGPVSATVDVSAGDAPVLTAAGEQWALYDRAGSRVVTAAGAVSLAGTPAEGSGAVLQLPGDDADAVYLASQTGLVAVPLDGSEPRVLVDETLGTPARPVVVAGCLYAAWSGGRTFRQCGSAEPERGVLQGLRPSAELEYRRGGDRLVLNDAAGGTVWAVQDGNRLIDNWAELTPENPDETQKVEDDETTPPDLDKLQQPPVAVDDEFGARPGRSSVLPVLLNDYDANGDVLVVDSVTAIPEGEGSVGIINQGQQLQLTLAPGATGTLRFEYTVSDGRGGTATATVTAAVRSDSENSPPRQARPARATVQQGGRVTTQVLADWFDPDGDPFYLAGTVAAAPDTASYTPQGTVVFGDGGGAGETRDVGLVVSDARAEGSGVLSVAVRAPGKVPIVADPFVVQVRAGQETTIKPLAHAHGGSGRLRLTAVPDKAEATIVPDFDGGTFRFASDVVRSHYLEYAVTDGTTTATGTIRVVVTAPAGANAKPVTVPHTAFVREQGTQEIDVLANDFDPAGGVLLVTAVTGVPPGSGLRVEILGQHILRVTLTRPLEEPVVFGYRVSNGLAEADGSVTVIQLPPPSVRQPPIAQPDTASVRVGDVIDIPVLDNDTQPDGDELTLDPALATPLPRGGGLLFASQNVLRYLAPETPGNYTAAYRVTGADGQWATATVTIAVRELDRSVNAPPVPKGVTARVLAGETVRIPIPLRGIDPDGDSVTLLGQQSNPQKGAVIRTESDWIEYQAGEYSTGTDSFDYQVVDALGARATGTVRIGIAGHQQTARNPVAVADEVTTRPGATVSVRVLDNDSDPDGGILSITSVVPSGNSARARAVDDVIRVDAPQQEGRYGFIYEIQNETGGTSSNFLTVVVSRNAPLARPVATDAVLRLSDILGKSSVDVDVLSGVFFADGPASSLRLSVLSGYDETASVTERGTIRVEVQPRRQIIPFEVANPEDPSITALAFIRIPGSDDALPQLRRAAPVLRVASEKTLRIDLNDYIVAVGGRKVRLTDASKVSASHANGDDLVVDDDTLQFTSADRYFGPASISFEVTDGESASDPDGRVATIVLPITVTPRENQPPVFSGGQLELEPGARRTIDLVKLTRYPYEKDQDELEYRVLEPRPAGISVSIDGQSMTLSVGESTPKGTATSVLVGVRDAINDGKAGRLELEVVPSTRPLAVPRDDAAVAPRGTTTTVDVLANDAAANPFPATPLRVIGVRGADAASLPTGVSVVPSPDRSRLTVTVAPDAVPGDSTVQYQVADATNDPSRYVWGTVRISVQDKPDPVGNLRVSDFGDRRLTLSWDPGPANNSPISEFQVTMTRAGTREPVSVTTCRSTSCELRTPGNGPENGVRLSVQARNAIGLSEAAAFPGAVWSDVLPNAPVALSAAPLDHGLRVSWRKPENAPGASAIHSYVVTVGGVSREVGAPVVSRGDPPGTRYSVDVTGSGIANGASVAYTVASRNDFYGGGDWNSASGVGVPAGPPIAVATPSAIPSTDGSGKVTVAWEGVFDANGRSITRFHAVGYRGSPPSCDPSTGVLGGGGVSATLDGSARSATLTVPTTRESWNFLVYAFNGQGCTASSPVASVPLSQPDAPQTVSIQPAPGGDNGTGVYLPVFQSASPAP